MEQLLDELICETNGEGFIDITPYINLWIKENELKQGILVISTKHTSCSLIINENADPNVLKDLSNYMKAIVPEKGFQSISGEGERREYLHSEEGIDDMPAHIRTALTCSSISLSVSHSKVNLGTWQAIYLWEHRYSKNIRKVNLHAIGEVTSEKQSELNKNIKLLLEKTNPSKLNKFISEEKNYSSSLHENIEDTNLDLLVDRIHHLISRSD